MLGCLVGQAIGFLNWLELGFLSFNAVQVGFKLKGANSKVEVGGEAKGRSLNSQAAIAHQFFNGSFESCATCEDIRNCFAYLPQTAQQ
ncbi:hypothetical protein H6F90_00540 [Trichocoleus sp. FACHB-591]|uniref:hypothetical protein n=1 Tax=Trichocoleus sp. FACHB-591 TaxID=2692872 RepID=UPI0016825315|nr:hypothetical protein [Trichocoleus sp. FACHB-591]MBD2093642.1 hypothetical protein [Trichocoleus sp. FACHB-591]